MPDGWAEKISAKICPVCDQPNRRKFFARCCSVACSAKFWTIAYWSTALRGKCFTRDDHKCVNCGAGNHTHEAWFERFQSWLAKIPWEDSRSFNWPALHYQKETGDLEPLKINLEADHIIPIALGGNEFDLENLQTLCHRCHNAKTAREASQFALARKNQLTLTEALKSGQQRTLTQIQRMGHDG